MRRLTEDAAILVVAPWLSPRTRRSLDELGYGYLDLTGNVSFRLARPAVVLRTTGAERDPDEPRSSDRSRLRGLRAGRLVRVLVDVSPPYQATELAAATALSVPWVSRLLASMEDEALIVRRRRMITDVDWHQLLRARAEHYRVLRANPPVSMLAPGGIPDVLTRVRERRAELAEIGSVAVTGSVAAQAVAPTAVGGQLMLYVPPGATQRSPLDRVAETLGLLRTDVGANVLLLRRGDQAVLVGRHDDSGVPHVALSQLALDLLGGTGRMPAEGDAVIDYMTGTEQRWRRRSLAEWDPEGLLRTEG